MDVRGTGGGQFRGGRFDAETYLRRLIEDRLAELVQAPDEMTGIAALHALHTVHGAAGALSACGILDAARARAILEDLDDELLQHGLMERVHRRLSGTSGGGAAPMAPAARPVLPELLRVAGLRAESDALIPGHRARFVSLDVWSDHFEVRLAISPPWTPQDRAAPRVGGMGTRWKGWDDQGGIYHTMGRSWGPTTESVRFEPGPHRGASRLWLAAHAEDGQCLVELVVELD